MSGCRFSLFYLTYAQSDFTFKKRFSFHFLTHQTKRVRGNHYVFCIKLDHNICVLLWPFTSVSCPIGYFHNASALSCQICPMDHYQDKEAQSSCIPCPEGMFTRGKEGSKVRDDCRGRYIFSFFYKTAELALEAIVESLSVLLNRLIRLVTYL